MSTKSASDKNGFACNHVVRKKRPVMLVAHGADGSWQFMCGKEDHTRQKQAKRVSLSQMFEGLTPGLAQEDVAPGQIAERKSRTVWEVRDLTEEERSDIEDEPEQKGGFRLQT